MKYLIAVLLAAIRRTPVSLRGKGTIAEYMQEQRARWRAKAEVQ